MITLCSTLYDLRLFCLGLINLFINILNLSFRVVPETQISHAINLFLDSREPLTRIIRLFKLKLLENALILFLLRFFMVGLILFFCSRNLNNLLFLLITIKPQFTSFFQITYVVVNRVNVLNIRIRRIMIFNTNKFANSTLFKVRFQWTLHVYIHLLWILHSFPWTDQLLDTIIIILPKKRIAKVYIAYLLSRLRDDLMLFIRMF